MTLLPIFISCVFTLFALWLMISPFLGGQDANLRLEHLDDEVREIELLVNRRAVLLTSLRELEFDRETAKLADDDYEKFRRRYEAEAVRIMRRLDELHGGKEWQQRVDAELADRLGKASVFAAPEEGEEEVAEAPEETSDQRAEAQADDGTSESSVDEAEEVAADAEASEPVDDDATDSELSNCAGCGEPLEADDKFCSQCGTPVVVPTQAEVPAPSEASA